MKPLETGPHRAPDAQALGAGARIACFSVAALLLLGLHAAATAQTEIYRCPQADGTIAFQEQPCPDAPEPASGDENETSTDATSGDDFFDFDNPFDSAPEAAQPPSEPATPSSAERDQCQKNARDAIDAIEQEMLQDYSPEQREEYLTRLRVHTRELRACDRLF